MYSMLISLFRLTRLVAVIGAMGLLVGTPVYAQEVDSVGTCGEDIRPPKGSSEDYFTIVGSPDIYVGADNDNVVDVAVTSQIPMHTRIRKVRSTEFRMLFVTTRKVLDGRQVCGWISLASDAPDALSMDARPVPVDNLVDWTDPVSGKTKRLKNPLPLKALLRSNPEREYDSATRVKIYDKPSIASRSRTDASVYGIYYIYSERLLDNGELWYWVAGEHPFDATPFSGWVPDTQVIIWGSQLSVYFNEQTRGTDIYASRDHAIRGDTEGRIGSRPKDFAERTIGFPVDSVNAANNIARFPIIEEVGSPDGSERSIYRIGFFGDDKEIGKQSDRSKIQVRVRNIDVLFVLDNTESMTEYFASVVAAVRNSTERIRLINESRGYDVNVKYAAALYGDYLDQSTNPYGEMEFEIAAELGPPGYTEHLKKLTRRAEQGAVYRDPVFRDRAEAGLAGLKLAIENLDWTPDTAFKVVVWIGDHGSRNAGDNESITLSDMIDVMTDNKVLLLPINVSGRYDSYWNSRFIEQGNRLASIRNLSTKVAHQGVQSNDYASAQEYIEASIATTYVASLTASISIRDNQSTETTLARNDLLNLNIPAAEADVRNMSTAICELAFGSEGCENLKSKGQFMAEGYVSFDEQLDNYSFWVNLTDQHLEALRGVLSRTCVSFDRGRVKRSLENAMLAVQRSMSSDLEYSSDMAIGEYLRRFLFLPAKHS